MPKAEDARSGRHLSLIARVAVATAAIVWVLRGQDWQELGAVLRRMSPWYFALGLATFVAGQFIIAFRWWVLLHAQTIRIALPIVFRLHFIGLFYNNLMPGSVGGDLLKAWYVTKHTEKRLEGALSVVVDRFTGLAGMLVMGAVAYFVFLRGELVAVGPAVGSEGEGGWLGTHRGLVLGATLAAAVLAAVVLLVHPGLRRRFVRLGGRAWRRGVALLRRGKAAVVVYCSKPLTMLLALLLTALSQGTVIVAFWLLGRNLGMEASLRHFFVIFPVMWVVAALPISVAGLGVLEAGIVELFVRLGGTVAEKALALAVCQRLVWVLASLPGGIIHLLGAHLPREIFVDGESPVN